MRLSYDCAHSNGVRNMLQKTSYHLVLSTSCTQRVECWAIYVWKSADNRCLQRWHTYDQLDVFDVCGRSNNWYDNKKKKKEGSQLFELTQWCLYFTQKNPKSAFKLQKSWIALTNKMQKIVWIIYTDNSGTRTNGHERAAGVVSDRAPIYTHKRQFKQQTDPCNLLFHTFRKMGITAHINLLNKSHLAAQRKHIKVDSSSLCAASVEICLQ